MTLVQGNPAGLVARMVVLHMAKVPYKEFLKKLRPYKQ
jgi:hypothetical protein